MKQFFSILFFIAIVSSSAAQQPLPDSLRRAFQIATDDSTRFKTARPIYTFFEETNRDSALYYAQFRYTIAKKYHRPIEEAYLEGQIAYQQIFLGRVSEALTNLTEAFQIANETKDAETWELTPFNTPGKIRQVTLSMLNHMYGHLKMQTGSTESVHYFKKGIDIGKEIGNDFRITVGNMVLAINYLVLNNPDSALLCARDGEQSAIRGNIKKYLANSWNAMGEVYQRKGNDSLALLYYHKALQTAISEANYSVVGSAYKNLINYYRVTMNSDSTLFYAIKNLAVIKSLGSIASFVSKDINLGKAYQDLALGYSLKNNKDSANKYMQLALTANDSLTGIKLNRLSAFQNLTLDEQIRQQNAEKEQTAIENKRKTYLLIAGIVVAFIIMLLIYRNNLQKQKAYNLLNQQKAETDLQKEKADLALQELKAAQSQLIQSEKMASLGELTAGIAHEIQNPLNFVNNFSEVNKELVDELKSELVVGNLQLATEIIDDLKANSEKINHHGKRADAIVKGMLQHSQSGKGQKELTDINALADEYLRLSYHGLRAKDNSFNATINIDFDNSIGKINIVPQDIGRVLLNLYNNAFYAAPLSPEGGFREPDGNHTPTVWISTKKEGNSILISVKDNGPGIPQNIIDKIFQPFFTTKPTGQGTGLGLSLTYDIVKAHGGEIKVETNEGDGTTFTILLKHQL